MKRNYKVDRMRIWAAVAVVLIHVTAYLPNFERDTLGNYHWYRPLLNIGVPFFFGVSGYLISKRPDKYIDQYWRNIGLKFLVYSIFYVIVDGLILLLKHQSISVALQSWLAEHDGYSIINGTWGQFHLWYLFALMISTYCYGWLLGKGLSDGKIFLGAFLVNVWVWLFPLEGSLEAIFRYGGMIKGMLYLSMGYYITNHPLPWFITKWHIVVVGVLYSILYNYASIGILSELGLVLVTYLLLENIIQRPGQEKWLNQWSDMSLDIYVLHVLFIKIVQLYGEEKVWSWFNSDLLYILLLSSVCVVGSVLIYPWFDRWFFQPLKGILQITDN